MNVRKEDWMAKKSKNIPHTTAKAKQGKHYNNNKQ